MPIGTIYGYLVGAIFVALSWWILNDQPAKKPQPESVLLVRAITAQVGRFIVMSHLLALIGTIVEDALT